MDEVSTAFLRASSEVKGLFGVSTGPDLVIRRGRILFLSLLDELEGYAGICDRTGTLFDSFTLEYSRYSSALSNAHFLPWNHIDSSGL